MFVDDVIVSISCGWLCTIFDGPAVVTILSSCEKVLSLAALKAMTKSSTSFRFMEVRTILFSLLSSDCTNLVTTNETVSV